MVSKRVTFLGDLLIIGSLIIESQDYGDLHKLRIIRAIMSRIFEEFLGSKVGRS